ncbi:MAG: ArsA-related P-loop ATPase [Deltaproteobacteria bacterium]|nr:ArsA-related P-loop ATPase [Deltaproteobacteria bacterium]
MQLTFITGKGGVGKSAVTAALASALESAGKKTGVIELGETRMSDFFDSKPPDYKGVRVKNGPTLFNFEANDCFEEYVGRLLPKQILILLKNRWVEHFIHAVPGLNEILLLGKITTLAEEENFDHLLIDAPATGHTVSLCDAPRIALAVLRHGPLKSSVEKIWEMIHDPKETRFLLVTQPEESIVQETIELYRHLENALGLSWQGMIVNGIRIENAVNKIPDEGPASLIAVLKEEKIKRDRQKELLLELKKEVGLETGCLEWQGNVEKESHLNKLLTEQIKPWVLKNFSIKKS